MQKTILAKDGLSVNAETVPGRFPVEPLNTVSNIVFLVFLIYWIKKTGFKFSRHPLIVTVMPILCLGLISATMHHAFRSDRMWHTIDMLAIFYAVIMTCVFLWYRVFGNWLKSFLFTMIFFIFWHICFATFYMVSNCSY